MVPASEVVREIILETKFQDLVSADSGNKVVIKGKEFILFISLCYWTVEIHI
jgi:hypothetical protein